VKFNNRKFLEFAHHHNFICIEYQQLEKNAKLRKNAANFLHKQIAKLRCCTNIAFYSNLIYWIQQQSVNLLDCRFCERHLMSCTCFLFLTVKSLFPTSVNRHSQNFSTWRGFSPKGSTAMLISRKCPVTKMRGETPHFAQFHI